MTINCSLRSAALGLTLAITLPADAQRRNSLDQPWEIQGAGKVIAPLIQARQASVQQMVISHLESHVQIDLLLDGLPRTINITPYSMRHPDCKFFISDESGMHEIAAPPITTYRGKLVGSPGSSVQASLYEGAFSASITDGAGMRWTIEPADRMIKGLPAQWSVVYRDKDLFDLDISCGVKEGEHELIALNVEKNNQTVTALGASSGVNGRTEIGIDADSTYVALFGSSAATIAAIEERMNIIDIFYRDQVGICYEITGFIIRTTTFAPYDATDNIIDLLCAFTIEWNDNVPDSGLGISRDMAHLFTNRHPAPGTVGFAWLNVVCDPMFISSCAAVPDRHHYGVSNDLSTLRLDWHVVAHEMGHNWSAVHCDGDPDCSIMLMTITTAVAPAFGATTTSAINSYQAGSACLAVCGARCVGDSDNNGVVNTSDLLELLTSWGTCDFPCIADTNNDDLISVVDLLALLVNWGACP